MPGVNKEGINIARKAITIDEITAIKKYFPELKVKINGSKIVFLFTILFSSLIFHSTINVPVPMPIEHENLNVPFLVGVKTSESCGVFRYLLIPKSLITRLL